MPKTAHFVNPWMVMHAIASQAPSGALCTHIIDILGTSFQHVKLTSAP
jgi:hypothetical protein